MGKYPVRFNKKLTYTEVQGGTGIDDKTIYFTYEGGIFIGSRRTAVGTIVESDKLGYIRVDDKDIWVNGFENDLTLSYIQSMIDRGDTTYLGYSYAYTVSEIQKLNVEDTAIENQYVSYVSETDGKITIGREKLPIIGVESDDHILSLDDTTKLASAIITADYASSERKIYLRGKNSYALSTIDCTDFIKDGILYDQIVFTATGASTTVTFKKGDSYTFTELIVNDKYLGLEFNDGLGKPDSKSFDSISLKDLTDIYIGSNAIDISNANVVSLKLSSIGNSSYLTIKDDGLHLDDTNFLTYAGGNGGGIVLSSSGNIAILTVDTTGKIAYNESRFITGDTAYAAYTYIIDVIDEDEKVISYALVDLDSRIKILDDDKQDCLEFDREDSSVPAFKLVSGVSFDEEHTITITYSDVTITKGSIGSSDNRWDQVITYAYISANDELQGKIIEIPASFGTIAATGSTAGYITADQAHDLAVCKYALTWEGEE